MEKSVNLAAVATVEETVKAVSNQSVKDTRGVFSIGETLKSAKEQLDKEDYSKVFHQLPFGETVGDKLIAIYNLDWLRHLSTTEHCKNLPYGYTNLYPLTKKELNDVKERKDFFIEAFTTGEFKLVDGTPVPTNKLTVKGIDDKLLQLQGIKKDEKKEEFDFVVGEIKVKKSAFEKNYEKYLELVKLIAELSNQEFSTGGVAFVEKSKNSNSLFNSVKKQREEDLKRELKLLQAA